MFSDVPDHGTDPDHQDHHVDEQSPHHDHSHHHHHDYEHDQEIKMSGELSNRLAKIQLGAAAVNAAVMLVRGTVAGIKAGAAQAFESVNIMSATDAGHNVIDWLKWKMEAAVDRMDISPRTYKIFRGLTCAALAGGGAWSIADATLLHSDYNAYQGAASGVSAGAALYTGNVLHNGVVAKYGDHDGVVDLWRNKMTERDKDKAIHAGTDIFMATGAAMANISGTVGNIITHSGISTGLGGVATALTIAGGTAAMVYFGVHTPFVRGLDKPDECLVHDHSGDAHDECGHEHHEEEPRTHPVAAASLLPGYRKKSWFEQVRSRGRHRQEKRGSWWRKSMAVGSIAVATCIGASSAGREAPLPQTPIAAVPETAVPLVDTHAAQVATVQPGDSQWSIASREITDVTAIQTPEERHVYELTQRMIESNQSLAPNPHRIYPGSVVNVPSIAAIQAIINQ